MRNIHTARSSIAAVVFGALLLSLSCSTTTQNTRVDTQTQEETAAAPAGKPSICTSGATPEEKIKFITDEILDKFDKEHGKLKKQRTDKVFDFKLVEFSSKRLIELQVDGMFRGSGKDGKETTFENFFDIVDQYLVEGCIQKITLAPQAGTGVRREIAFEWQLCEHPDVYCSDGICKPVGSCIKMDGNTNTPVDTNTNTNSASNLNTSNTNTGRRANTSP